MGHTQRGAIIVGTVELLDLYGTTQTQVLEVHSYNMFVVIHTFLILGIQESLFIRTLFLTEFVKFVFGVAFAKSNFDLI